MLSLPTTNSHRASKQCNRREPAPSYYYTLAAIIAIVIMSSSSSSAKQKKEPPTYKMGIVMCTETEHVHV